MAVKQAFKKKLLYIDDNMRVEYAKGQIFFLDRKTGRMVHKQSMEASFWLRLCAGVPALERMLRCEPRSVIRWAEMEYLVSHRGALYRISLAARTCVCACKYMAGTKNPLHFCKYERNGQNELVFGDYGGHAEDGSVGIYRYTDDGLRRLAFFTQGRVDHIHRVEYDAYRDCYWIFTGDTDEASGIWELDHGGNKIRPYLVGKQCYRACVAFIEKDRIVFATDTPLEKNDIYSIRISDKSTKRLHALPGPCIYGMKVRGGKEWLYCFSTSVEPDSRLPASLYWITYKLGAGVRDRFSYLIAGSMEQGFRTVWRARKDALPMGLFQFGNHRFPVQQEEGTLYFCPQGCRRKGTWRLTWKA